MIRLPRHRPPQPVAPAVCAAPGMRLPEADQCGTCGMLLGPEAPSPYFCNESHQALWTRRHRPGRRPPEPDGRGTQ